MPKPIWGIKAKIIAKKKIKSIYGKIELRKDHVYIKGMRHHFNISPLVQSHTLEFGYQLPFKRAMKLLNTVLPRVNMGCSQSQRLMQYFGSLDEVEEQLKEQGFQPSASHKAADKEILYAQVDGGHLLTDTGYREKSETLITYYQKNGFRMKYQEYVGKGFCIGSGAIESAISTVAQQRCKLVGQRWPDRVKSVLNIRALYMSSKKENLLKIINHQMGYSSAA